jgi:tetratricopeptide (TPR) repeat protein
MQKILLLLLILQGSLAAYAQRGAVSKGDSSPILIGARNKVNYIKKVETRNNIPDSLVPYLAGLIFSNKDIGSRTSGIDNAIHVWMNKYFELEKKIKAVHDLSKMNICLKHLGEGDFNFVEQTLNISTDYQTLKKIFPATYQTNGNQSPIIVGDFGTVTYIVNELVTYDLPDGLTVNLLNQLKLSKDTIKLKSQQAIRLTMNIESREAKIREYIAKYRLVEQQLKESPGTINKQVLVLFRKQDYDGALKLLDKAKGSDAAIASNELIKARILTLQLDYKAFDSTLNEINKAYNISTTIAPTYNSLLEYGKFLTEYYYTNITLAIPVLNKAMDSASTVEKRVIVTTYLSDAYMGSDILRGMQLIQQALAQLSTKEPITDSAMLVNKATLQFYLGRGYSLQLFDTVNYRKALNLTLDARTTLNKIHPLSTDLKYRQAVFDKALGSYSFSLRDTVEAIEYFNRSIQFFENPENANLAYLNAYVRANQGLAQLYSQLFQLDKANAILLKTIDLIKTSVRLNSKVYVQEIEQTYTTLIVNLWKVSRADDALKYSEEFRDMITPFIGKNSDGYHSLALAEVDVDLGTYYLQRKDFKRSYERLQSAYAFFVGNLSTAIADKIKFVSCIYTLHFYYVTTNQPDSGIVFNKNLARIIADNKGANFLEFTDLESQVSYQISELYFFINKLDSADAYIRKAIFVSEAKARQGPLENIKYYGYQTCGLCRILMRENHPATVDSLTDAFISACNTMSNFTPFIRDHYRGMIGYQVGAYGAVISEELDTLKSKDPDLVKRYMRCQDRAFTESQKHFDVANKFPTQEISWYYANFLYVWAKQQHRWESYCPKSDVSAYEQKKNSLLQEATNITNNLPPAPLLDSLRQQMTQLAALPQAGIIAH